MRVKNIDVVFLAIMALSSLVSLLLHFVSGYVLSINEYAGFLLLAIVIFFQVYRPAKFNPGVAILLILGTLNIVGFSYAAFNSSIIHITDDVTYNPPGFNPVLFLMLVVYFFINFNFIKGLLAGKRDETEADDEMMTEFYYNKFAEESTDEFKSVIERIDKYPAEAQVAIQRLIDERNV